MSAIKTAAPSPIKRAFLFWIFNMQHCTRAFQSKQHSHTYWWLTWTNSLSFSLFVCHSDKNKTKNKTNKQNVFVKFQPPSFVLAFTLRSHLRKDWPQNPFLISDFSDCFCLLPCKAVAFCWNSIHILILTLPMCLTSLKKFIKMDMVFVISYSSFAITADCSIKSDSTS